MNDRKKDSNKKNENKRKNEPIIKKKLSGCEYKKKRIEKEAAVRKNAQHIPSFFGKGLFVVLWQRMCIFFRIDSCECLPPIFIILIENEQQNDVSVQSQSDLCNEREASSPDRSSIDIEMNSLEMMNNALIGCLFESLMFDFLHCVGCLFDMLFMFL